MDRKETGYNSMDWIYLAWVTVQWKGPVNMAMKLRASLPWGERFRLAANV